jgi:hypothetical protein
VRKLLADEALAGSIFMNTAVAVVCGLGKSCLILGVYPELFELTLSLFDGFKKRKIPSPQNTGMLMQLGMFECIPGFDIVFLILTF